MYPNEPGLANKMEKDRKNNAIVDMSDWWWCYCLYLEQFGNCLCMVR